MDSLHPTFTLVLALAAGVLAQSVARHIRVPGIVLLLIVGAGLGPDGLGWVDSRDLGSGLTAVIDLAVAVILFEGGLNLQIARLRREQAAIRRLVTWGALITLAGGALAAHALLDWDLRIAVLFGSLVVVTGPTVVSPLVRALRLRTRVTTVLEAEGVLIDPIGALLAVLTLALVLAPAPDSLAAAGMDLLVRLGFGTFAGAAGGFVLAGTLRVRNLIPEGLENIFTLAAVLLLYQGCEQVISHSGILAVTIAGTVVGNMQTPVARELREFKDQLTVMLIGLIFVLLAADVRYEQVISLGLPGLGVVAMLVLVVRPIGVWLSTLGSDLSRRERIFISCVAPRGIVAAAIASVTAVALENEGVAGGGELRALVFLTIGFTVLLAGLTAGPLARLLAVQLPERGSVAILGAQRLGMALAEELRTAGTPVVFVDSNPQNCRHVEEAGFPVVYGNALEERTLQRARLENVRTAIGLTANNTVNAVFVSRARELFRVPEGLVAVDRMGTGMAGEMVESEQLDVAFDGPHDVERWDVRSRRGSVEIEHRIFSPDDRAPDAEGEPPRDQERFAILVVQRGERAIPMSMRFTPKAGDVASIAVHTVDREEAYARLAELGWLLVPQEAEGGVEAALAADG